MGINVNDSIFLTQEEQDLLLLSKTEVDEKESEQQAFENAIMEVHKQYNLRSNKDVDNPTKKYSKLKKTTDTTSKIFPDILPKKILESLTKRIFDPIPKKSQTNVPSTIHAKDTSQNNFVEKSNLPNQNKTQISFNLESGLEKLKIPIPLI
jgi:hypothetical protein